MGETALHICCETNNIIVNSNQFKIVEENLNSNELEVDYPSDQSSQPAQSISWNNQHVTFSPNNEHINDYQEFENYNLEVEIPQLISSLIEKGADISIRNKV